MIDYYSGSALVNCVTSFALGVLFVSKKSRYKGFAAYNLSIAFWSFFYVWWQLSSSIDSARVFCALLMIGATLIPRYYFISVLEIVNRPPDSLVWMRNLNNIAVVVFIPLLFTKLIIHSFSPKLGFQYWPNAGPVFPIFLTYFFINVLAGFVLLYLAYKKTGSPRYLLILATTLIAFTGGSTNYFLWINVPIPPYGNSLIVGYAILIAIAIAKHNLLDISMVITRHAAWALSVVILASGYVMVSLATSVGTGYNLPPWVLSITLTYMVGALSMFPKLRLWIQTEAQKKFLKGHYNYRETLSKLVSKFSDSTSLPHFIGTVEHHVAYELEVDKAILIVRSDLSNPSHSTPNFLSSDQSIRLEPDHPLLSYFNEEIPVIKLDTMETPIDGLSGFRLAFPCRYQNQLFGIILIGKKLTENRFSNDDMSLLPLLATQAGLVFHRLNQMRFETELKIAQKIQSELIPKRPSITGVQIAARMVTASEMGGDYYDIHHTPTGDWVILGDVTGHGIESAMVMIMVQSIVATLLQLNPTQSPSELIAGINQSLMSTVTRLNDPRPMTIVALFTSDGRRFAYSGSHDPMLKISGDECTWIDVDQFPIGVGIIDDDHVFAGENQTITLAPGDILYIGTDGISEAACSGDYAAGVFGPDRIETIIKTHIDHGPDTIASQLVTAVDQFTGETQHDDMTFIILKAG